MKSRLPQLFNNNSIISHQNQNKKKQGGIFQLHLSTRISPSDMNATFTSGFTYNKNKSTTRRQSNKFIKNPPYNSSLYKTLQLSTQRYSIPKQQRLLFRHISAFKSIKQRSFSLQKNPQSCHPFHNSQQQQNINSIIQNQREQLSSLQHKIMPFRFVAKQYRTQIQRICKQRQKQINQLQNEVSSSIGHLRNMLSSLRRETNSQIKKNKIDIEKYQQQIKMLAQMSSQYDEIIEDLAKKL